MKRKIIIQTISRKPSSWTTNAKLSSKNSLKRMHCIAASQSTIFVLKRNKLSLIKRIICNSVIPQTKIWVNQYFVYICYKSTCHSKHIEWAALKSFQNPTNAQINSKGQKESFLLMQFFLSLYPPSCNCGKFSKVEVISQMREFANIYCSVRSFVVDFVDFFP